MNQIDIEQQLVKKSDAIKAAEKAYHHLHHHHLYCTLKAELKQ